MIYQVHTEIRNAYEMARGTTPEARDWQTLLDSCIQQMQQHISQGMSVVITTQSPSSGDLPSSSETILTLTTSEELDIYRNLVGADQSTLRDQMYAAKLQNALSETNFNRGGQAVRPILEGPTQ